MSFYCSFYRNSSFYKTHSDWMRKYSIQQFFQKLHTKSTEREQIVENNKISWFQSSIFKFPFVASFCASSIDFLKSSNKLLVYGLFLLIANINLKAGAKLQQWEIKKIFPLLSFLRWIFQTVIQSTYKNMDAAIGLLTFSKFMDLVTKTKNSTIFSSQ